MSIAGETVGMTASEKGDLRRSHGHYAVIMCWAAVLRCCGLSRLSEALSQRTD